MAVTRIRLSVQEENARKRRVQLELSTAEIGLSVRTTNCLEEKGIFTVRDLLHSSRDELLSISNFGEKTLDEVFQALEVLGFPRSPK
jgi:DNA-directed RNA polymerase subunit alpha